MTWSEPPFGPAIAGRGLLVRRQILERASASAWSAKDISASRWSYRLRAWDPAARTATVLNVVVAKSATAAASGWLDGYVPLGAAATVALEWELVECDSGGTDESTLTGQREVVLVRYSQAIEAAPSAA